MTSENSSEIFYIVVSIGGYIGITILSIIIGLISYYFTEKILIDFGFSRYYTYYITLFISIFISIISFYKIDYNFNKLLRVNKDIKFTLY